MIKFLGELKQKVAIGFVGGSDFGKISEQLSVDGRNGPLHSSTAYRRMLTFYQSSKSLTLGSQRMD